MGTVGHLPSTVPIPISKIAVLALFAVNLLHLNAVSIQTNIAEQAFSFIERKFFHTALALTLYIDSLAAEGLLFAVSPLR